MKFNEFLNENSDRKKEISIEEAYKIIKEKCKNANLFEPIVRGSKNKLSTDAAIIQGNLGVRRSIENGNYYTILIDQFLPSMNKNYPLRSKSIICATYYNKVHASTYGKLYAVFPYDDTILGKCNDSDIWFTQCTINDVTKDLTDWNRLFIKADISDDNYKNLVKDIYNICDSNDDTLSYSQKIIKDIFVKDTIEKDLKTAYTDLDFEFGTSSDLDLTDVSEIWIGGPCIVIELDEWFNFLDNIKDEI